jgi:hypothetical protein
MTSNSLRVGNCFDKKKKCRYMNLTTHMHIVQNTRLNGAETPLPSYSSWLVQWQIYVDFVADKTITTKAVNVIQYFKVENML